jgi:hypothetical protein
LVSVAAGYFSSTIRSLSSLWLEAKSSHGHLNDFVWWHMTLLAHSRMCKEPEMPYRCGRIAEGIDWQKNMYISDTRWKQRRADAESKPWTTQSLALDDAKSSPG